MLLNSQTARNGAIPVEWTNWRDVYHADEIVSSNLEGTIANGVISVNVLFHKNPSLARIDYEKFTQTYTLLVFESALRRHGARDTTAPSADPRIE